MNRLLTISIMAGGVLLFSANAQAASIVSTKGQIETARGQVVAIDSKSYAAASARYLTHLNNARFALTRSQENTARRELRRAFGELDNLKLTSGKYAVTDLKTGRTFYNYVSSSNYYYFPIEIDSKLNTEDYLEPYRGVDTSELEVAYLRIDPNNTDSQNLLFIADRYTRAGEYVEADAAISELIRATVETGKIATLPQERAKLHLIMAKYHFKAGNFSSALNRLDNAEFALSGLAKESRYRPRLENIKIIQQGISDLRAALADGKPYTEVDEGTINSWINYLHEWS